MKPREKIVLYALLFLAMAGIVYYFTNVYEQADYQHPKVRAGLVK
jgi:hypothetical protein